MTAACRVVVLKQAFIGLLASFEEEMCYERKTPA
jgi:hypothetical protein